MRNRPDFDPGEPYNADLAEGIRQARAAREDRFCLADDPDNPAGICLRPSSPADPDRGCARHPRYERST